MAREREPHGCLIVLAMMVLALGALLGYSLLADALSESEPETAQRIESVVRMLLLIGVPVAVLGGLWRGTRPLNAVRHTPHGWHAALTGLSAAVAVRAMSAGAKVSIVAVCFLFAALIAVFGVSTFLTRLAHYLWGYVRDL